MGYYYRHNIHPFTECLKREDTLKTWSDNIGLKVIYQEGYEIENFFRDVAYRESKRCSICYYKRMKASALIAKKGKFNAFSTTLLYSKFQNHEEIVSISESVSQETGVPFYYHDFRKGWKEGIETSKKLEMYRQKYCGCIYSEKERYLGPAKK